MRRIGERRGGVLHVFAPGPVGGLEEVVLRLATVQHQAGTRVSVAGVLDEGAPPHPVLESLNEAGVPVYAVTVAARAYGREREALAGVIRLVGPRVVHTHGYRADVVDAPVARRFGAAVVSTVHGFTGGGWRNRVYEALQIRALRDFDAVVAVATSVARKLRARGVPGPRTHVIQNAWQPTQPPLGRVIARIALGINPIGFVIGWVGRLSREKGCDLFLDSLARLPRIPWRASVLGAGAEEASLRRRTAEAGVADSVRWHGAVSAAYRYFPAFDVFVLSSRTEGTPMVLFEAMASGVPIVATRVGGVPDVVSDDEAVLVPPGDRDALAAAILQVWRDPRSAATRAARARQRLFRDFATGPWVAAYDRVYAFAQRRADIARYARAGA